MEMPTNGVLSELGKRVLEHASKVAEQAAKVGDLAALGGIMGRNVGNMLITGRPPRRKAGEPFIALNAAQPPRVFDLPGILLPPRIVIGPDRRQNGVYEALAVRRPLVASLRLQYDAPWQQGIGDMLPLDMVPLPDHIKISCRPLITTEDEAEYRNSRAAQFVVPVATLGGKNIETHPWEIAGSPLHAPYLDCDREPAWPGYVKAKARQFGEEYKPTEEQSATWITHAGASNLRAFQRAEVELGIMESALQNTDLNPRR